MDDTNTILDNISGPALVNRIDKVLSQKLISRQQLADACGFSSPNIARWRTKGALPDLSVGVKIAKFLGVPLYWLITGENEFDEKAEDRELLTSFRVLNDEDKNVVIACIKALSQKYIKKGFEGFQETD